jgi:hypothetical protein
MEERKYLTVKEILKILNMPLERNDLNIKDLCDIFSYINKVYKKRIVIVDFEMYNSECCGSMKTNKENAIKMQDFELAADMRYEERKCLRIIEIKEQLKLKNSAFKYINKSFVYFYAGTTKNDKKLMDILRVNNWMVSAFT